MSCPRCGLEVPAHGRADDMDVCPRCLAQTRGALSVWLSPGATQERSDRHRALGRLLRGALESMTVYPPWVPRGGGR